MNYKKIYDDLMQSRLIMKEARISARKAGEYFEAHHIVPVCMGGKGNPQLVNGLKHHNLVLLTAREHYIAHALLFLIYRTRELMVSFQFFCTIRKGKNYTYKVSARMYEFLKQERSRLGFSEETKQKLSKSLKGNKNSAGNKMTPETKERLRQLHKNKVLSEETKQKISKSLKGNKNSEGRLLSEETKQKISKTKKEKFASGEHTISEKNREIIRERNRNRVFSEQTRRKISQSKLGKPRDEQTREKLRKAHTGKKHSTETKEKIRLSWTKKREEKMNMTKCHTT